MIPHRIAKAVAAPPGGIGASRRRTASVLVAATVLPLLIYASVSTAVSYRNDREAQEAATVARAKEISQAVDARLAVISATMRALATIRSIRQENWAEARQRVAEIAALDPSWRDVALVDLRNSRTVVELQRGDEYLTTDADKMPQPATIRSRPTFGGVVRHADGHAAIIASMSVGGGRYALLVALDPAAIQSLLISSAPHAGVSALVDRRGRFIARTTGWPQRLGTLATRYVRDAIAQDTAGVYRGVTYEGFENYSGFFTSPETGWSTHVAVSSEVIDGPRNGWRAASKLAAIFGLSLALALVLLILRLVAVRRSADERTQQTERIEAIGKLTGGIAHDFNNMLAIVIGSLELAQRRLRQGGGGDVEGFIDNALDGATRAADLTRRLLVFSRQQPLAASTVDVNELVASTTELLRRTLPENITIDLQLQQGLWPVRVDRSQLENAIVNLAVNARDAMPDGGRLTLGTENRTDPSKKLSETVALWVRDTGTGMPASVVARAFEPFFTTKHVGKGSGLGLSQIHGFAVQSGGEVQISTAPGQGTSVTLLLPRGGEDHGAAPSSTSEDLRASQPCAAPATILVVEDDPRVRRMSVAALQDLGYTVRQAADANEALALLDAEPDVRLMLTDIVMPGMSGRELAALVTRTYPHIGIILVTGYEPDQPAEEGPAILHKPFGVSLLALRVRQELEQSA